VALRVIVTSIRKPFVATLLIAITAAACSGGGNHEAGAAVSSRSGAEATLALPQDGKAKGRRRSLSASTDWQSLSAVLPSKLAGYHAIIQAEGSDLDLVAGMSLLFARRAYGKDNVTVDVEVLDTAHCPRVRELFKRSRDVTRETDKAVIRSFKLAGFPAQAQWLDATHVARTSVLVRERFLVNSNLKPADSPAPGIAFVQKLDWAALERLATGAVASEANELPPPSNEPASKLDASAALSGESQPASEADQIDPTSSPP
jgi:hypothetical protein